MSNRITILENLLKLEKEKQSHLDQYKNNIELMAKEKSPNIFIQPGECETCSRLEKEIKELQDQL